MMKTFINNLNKMKNNEESSTDILKAYLDEFSQKQFELFVRVLMHTNDKEEKYFFDKWFFWDLVESLNILSREADDSIPSADTDYENFLLLEKENPYYFFDYANKEDIIHVLLLCISKVRMGAAVYVAQSIASCTDKSM